MEMIEKTQYQAALAITGTWRGTSRNKLYEELGWESLSDRRWYKRLFQFYKICNDMTPTYLLDSVPRQRRLLYGNTSYNSYYEIYCRTTRYMNSFFPDCIKKWNAIGNEIKACSSLGIFKRNILALIRPTSKPIFGIHDSIGLKYLFQLRVGLSPLKSHKRRHNFIDTPTDWCDCLCAPEDTHHFLIKCNKYAEPRINLCISVTDILALRQQLTLSENVNLYLYGHVSLNYLENKNVLLSTIKFIKDTNRSPPPPSPSSPLVYVIKDTNRCS